MCPVTLPLVVAGDGGGCLKLRALAGRSLSVFLSLSIQAVAYLPVEYSSGARNGDRYGKEAENVQRTWLCELFCFALLFFRSAPQNFPPKKILSRRNIASLKSTRYKQRLRGGAASKKKGKEAATRPPSRAAKASKPAPFYRSRQRRHLWFACVHLPPPWRVSR